MAMPFGKKKVEESINDKFVRLFKEGMTVEQISKEEDVKPDVIANVIRRRLGEDALPETVIRSKNALPQHEEVKLKAEAAAEAPAAPAEEPASEEASSEGLSKLEQFMLEKEKKRADEAPAPEPEKNDDPELGVMEGISLDEASILEKLGGGEPPVNSMGGSVSADDTAGDMAGLDTADLAKEAVIEEAPIAAYSEPDIVEEIKPEPVVIEPAPIPEPVKVAPAPAPMPEIPHGNGSAFDKMKAFAKMQVAANNDKLAELEAKLGSVEGDYTAQLATAEKALTEAKVAYEDVIKSGDGVEDKRDELNREYRAALARAEEDYRRKQEELDNEYNDAIAKANSDHAIKQDKLNAEIDEISSKKETAKNDFLSRQSEVNKIKNKIASEVDTVKAEIASLKEENKGYESFLG